MGSEGSALCARTGNVRARSGSRAWDRGDRSGSGAGRGRWARALMSVVLVTVLASCLPEGAEEVPFRMDASNQAGWWSPLVERDGDVFVAYNAWGTAQSGASNDTHTVYVARRDAAGTWVRGCMPAATGTGCATYIDDIGHRQPSIAIDGAGYIHVFASMHHDQWRYFRSAAPLDPTTFVDASAEMPDLDGAITYPNATGTPSGDVYVIVRNYPDGKLYRWDDAADVWSLVATFASTPDYVVYPDDIISDAAGVLHIAWEWAYDGPNGLRHLGSYMRYDPATGVFSDAAGTPIEVPATLESTTVYQPLLDGELSTAIGADNDPAGFQSAKLAIDPATGFPVAVYRMRATDGGKFDVRYAAWNGTEWARETVYAGMYTTHAAIDVTFDDGQPRVYYAKAQVPNKDQAFAAVRQPGGGWVEEPPLLPGIPVERLAVVQDAAGTLDHIYMSAPPDRKLYVRRLELD
jgi:hypothetical protein